MPWSSQAIRIQIHFSGGSRILGGGEIIAHLQASNRPFGEYRSLLHNKKRMGDNSVKVRIVVQQGSICTPIMWTHDRPLLYMYQSNTKANRVVSLDLIDVQKWFTYQNLWNLVRKTVGPWLIWFVKFSFVRNLKNVQLQLDLSLFNLLGWTY